MINSHEIVTSLRKIFNNVCKTIYVDLDYYKTTKDDEGKEITIDNIPFIIDMIFYLILSQYFKKVKIKFAGEHTDLRISIFEIRASRMGKGQMIKIIEEAGKNLGLKVKRISYLNQASLIGTINQFAVEYNLKKHLTPSMSGYINPVINGDLANYDIIIIPEAKKLVKGINESETEFILSTFQEALDYPGYISKKLKYEFEINYESKVSIFATTYYIEEIANLLLEQGFFQRILIDKKNFTVDEVEKIRQLIIEKYRQTPQTTIGLQFSDKMKRFTDIIKEEYKQEEKELEFTDDAIKMLHKFNTQFFLDIKGISGKELEIMKSFSQTIIHFITKIAGINCCLRDDTKIIPNDMGVAVDFFNIYSKILTTQLNISEKKNSVVDNDKRLILQYYKDFVREKQYYPGKDEFRTYCNKKGFGSIHAFKLIELLHQENYFIIEKGEYGKQRLKLVE